MERLSLLRSEPSTNRCDWDRWSVISPVAHIAHLRGRSCKRRGSSTRYARRRLSTRFRGNFCCHLILRAVPFVFARYTGDGASAQPLPHNPRKQRKNPAAAGSEERFREGKWRRGWDSNPRDAFDAYSLSRGAPSTTRPPLRAALFEDLRAFGKTGSCAFARRLALPAEIRVPAGKVSTGKGRPGPG